MQIVKPASEALDHVESRDPSISNPIAVAAIWSFYRHNPDKVILKVAFISIRVRDLRILFEMIAGPEPV